jgi:hypothetical protein
MSIPIKGVAYDFYLSLVNIDEPQKFKINPTLAAGDFTVTKDGVDNGNLATLPVVTPAGSALVKVSLSANEMNADKVTVLAIDQAGDEWADLMAFLDLPNGTVETVTDILEGDHTESSARLLIKKKDTETVLIDKTVTGSLLTSDITVNTREPE